MAKEQKKNAGDVPEKDAKKKKKKLVNDKTSAVAPKKKKRTRGRTRVRAAPQPRKKPEALSRAELLALAEAAGIKYRTRMSKVQLLSSLGLTVTITPTRKVSTTTEQSRSVAAPATAAPEPVEPQADMVFIDRGQPIPSVYYHDVIELMVRDPRCLFTYWELTGDGVERAPAGWNWVLRITRVKEDVYYDVEVDIRSENWYLNVEPDTCYKVEIGCVGPMGEFFLVASSREMHMPRAGESAVEDSAWRTPAEEHKTLMQSLGFAEKHHTTLGTPGSPWLMRRAMGGASGMFSPSSWSNNPSSQKEANV